MAKISSSAKASKTSKTSKSKINSEDLFLKIQKKAYELYEKRGSLPGYEGEDWLEAERLIKNGKDEV